MMNAQIKSLDAQIKSLVSTCTQTGNFQKLSATFLDMISTQADIIGVKAGISRRNQEKEQVHEYLHYLNNFFSRNYKFQLCSVKVISELKTIETLFSKNDRVLPKDYLKRAIEIYYDLRQVDVPEVRIATRSSPSQKRGFGWFSRTPVESPTTTLLKDLLLEEIDHQQLKSQKVLASEFDEEAFSTVNRLQQVRSALETHNNRKYAIKGKLGEDPRYQSSQASLQVFMLLGITVLFGVLEGLVIFESILFPYLLGSVSPYLLVFFIATVGFGFLTAKKLYSKEDR